MVESAPRLSLPSIVVNPVSVQRTDHCEKKGRWQKGKSTYHAVLSATSLHYFFVRAARPASTVPSCEITRLASTTTLYSGPFRPRNIQHNNTPCTTSQGVHQNLKKSNNLQHATQNNTTTPKQQHHHHITRLPQRTSRPRAVVTTVQCKHCCVVDLF